MAPTTWPAVSWSGSRNGKRGQTGGIVADDAVLAENSREWNRVFGFTCFLHQAVYEVLDQHSRPAVHVQSYSRTMESPLRRQQDLREHVLIKVVAADTAHGVVQDYHASAVGRSATGSVGKRHCGDRTGQKHGSTTTFWETWSVFALEDSIIEKNLLLL